MRVLTFISTIFILLSCNSESLKSSKDNQISTDLFIELWELFDENYAFFELRNVNWKAEKKKHLQKIATIQNDTLLFEEFCNLLKSFDDSHINLDSDELSLNCNGGELPDFYKEFPTNEAFTTFLDARDKSLKKIGINKVFDSESKLFQFGLDERGEWGFLRIKRFYGEELDKIRAELNDILGKLKDVENLIIDIRVNPGGNDETGLLCASYFFKEKEIAFIKKTRNGTDYEDFSEPDTTFVFPNKDLQVNNQQIYLLTNGASGSSADVFALVMSYLPNLTIVGTNTEGIFSDMYRASLSNGWSITLSNERYFSKDMFCYEKIGIPVDIEVKNKKEDTDKGKDLVIDAVVNIEKK